MVGRLTIWQTLWYTCAVLFLVVATGCLLLGAPALGALYLVMGSAQLLFVSRSTRRRQQRGA